MNTTTNRLVVDAEGARDIGPSEAGGLVRECLALTHKRYDAALWRALMELESPAPGPDLAARSSDPEDEPLELRIARVVRRDNAKLGPRFRAEFDRLFTDRRDGKPRERGGRGPQELTLALVGEDDHTGQVSLKKAVEAMKGATREEGFGFDLRVRMIMREEATGGEYDNPWGATLLCDALGSTCRGLWGQEGVWRPIMLHLVQALTPEIVALRDELDHFLQDRDVLPVLKVRTRSRARGGGEPVEPADLFGKLARKYGEDTHREAAASGAAPAPPAGGPHPGYAAPGYAPPGYAPPGYPGASGGGTGYAPQAFGDDPLSFGSPPGWQGAPPAPAGTAWAVLDRALALLQSSAAMPAAAVQPGGLDPAVLGHEGRNVLPVLAATVAANGDMPLPRTVMDIVSAALDEVFENPYLPPEVKIVFGRLQIPILKAALKDREVLSDPRHPARRFFDELAAASVGVRPSEAQDALFLELADHLAAEVHDSPDDVHTFERTRDELAHFLDAERASYNQRLAQALPSLLALDAEAEARGRARTALAVKVGSRTLAPEVRDFLDREVLARLTAAYQDGGADSAAALGVMVFVDDLLWSLAPDRSPGARKRLLLLIPRLVRSIGEQWPLDDGNRVRRKVFLARLYELHVEAMQQVNDLPPADADDEPAPRARAPIPETPRGTERDEAADSVESLLRGDWCAFVPDDEGAAPLLAKYAWRSPHGSQMLFAHRDGAVAAIHTPKSLADAFRAGKARVAVEAVPAFERAMEKLLEARA